MILRTYGVTEPNYYEVLSVDDITTGSNQTAVYRSFTPIAHGIVTAMNRADQPQSVVYTPPEKRNPDVRHWEWIQGKDAEEVRERIRVAKALEDL